MQVLCRTGSCCCKAAWRQRVQLCEVQPGCCAGLGRLTANRRRPLVAERTPLYVTVALGSVEFMTSLTEVRKAVCTVMGRVGRLQHQPPVRSWVIRV